MHIVSIVALGSISPDAVDVIASERVAWLGEVEDAVEEQHDHFEEQEQQPVPFFGHIFKALHIKLIIPQHVHSQVPSIIPIDQPLSLLNLIFMHLFSKLERILILASSISLVSVLGIASVLACIFFAVSATRLFSILLRILWKTWRDIYQTWKRSKKVQKRNKDYGVQTEVCEQEKYEQQNEGTKQESARKTSASDLMTSMKQIRIGDLYKIRENLKKAYLRDDFLIMEEPATVVTPGIQIIEGLGGISAWVLHKSRFGQRPPPRAEGSGEDTQTESNPEAISDEQLELGIYPILKDLKACGTHREKALSIYNQLSGKYSHYSITVAITRGRCKGIWNSLADFLYKSAREDEEILIILT